ncbi:MAG: DUF3817 domain-containing protein [Mycobacteriales bacterium]
MTVPASPSGQPRSWGSPLRRFRVMAYLVGVGLAILVFVAVPLQIAGYQAPVRIVGTLHGFLFPVYVVCTLELGIRRRWHVGKVLLVALAGTVPLMSFVAERKVVRRDLADHPPPADTVPAELASRPGETR